MGGREEEKTRREREEDKLKTLITSKLMIIRLPNRHRSKEHHRNMHKNAIIYAYGRVPSLKKLLLFVFFGPTIKTYPMDLSKQRAKKILG